MNLPKPSMMILVYASMGLPIVSHHIFLYQEKRVYWSSLRDYCVDMKMILDALLINY